MTLIIFFLSFNNKLFNINYIQFLIFVHLYSFQPPIHPPTLRSSFILEKRREKRKEEKETREKRQEKKRDSRKETGEKRQEKRNGREKKR